MKKVGNLIHVACGLDPGDKGAVIGFDSDHTKQFELPFYKKRLETFWFFYNHRGIYYFDILQEEVWGQLGSGTKQIFGFGKSCGFVRDLVELTKITCNVELIEPQMWKKEFSLLKKPKEAANEVVKRLDGEYTHADLMDARLIAELKWRRTFAGGLYI